ncbi:hypothetical protein H1P_1410012 [Hyella patelloides LEGE 07179]|uniref:Uncharacterized protein n=1 Tax=Hyella patelloides LEGE 07179 TaxID=945734 RepID=A0A563VLR3_9CYAN|nr:hypothetical protein H1P_1410012 [Hyella patelloides LEGE 07179]
MLEALIIASWKEQKIKDQAPQVNRHHKITIPEIKNNPVLTNN